MNRMAPLGAEESFVVELSMPLSLQPSRKRARAVVMTLISATLLAACQPNPNPNPGPAPNPGPVPRVPTPTPTPTPEPNREPGQPLQPKSTANASGDVLTREA
jgi:hypothetical protein